MMGSCGGGWGRVLKSSLYPLPLPRLVAGTWDRPTALGCSLIPPVYLACMAFGRLPRCSASDAPRKSNMTAALATVTSLTESSLDSQRDDMESVLYKLPGVC